MLKNSVCTSQSYMLPRKILFGVNLVAVQSHWLCVRITLGCSQEFKLIFKRSYLTSVSSCIAFSNSYGIPFGKKIQFYPQIFMF
jgi:hypothetical protein